MPALNPAGKSKQVRAKLRKTAGNRGGSRRDSGAGGLRARVGLGSCEIFHGLLVRTLVASVFQCFHLAWDTDLGCDSLKTLALLLTQGPGLEPFL